MRAIDDAAPGRDIVELLDKDGSPGGEIVYDVAVVYDLAADVDGRSVDV